MSERGPHRRALPNYERDKRRAFEALGYSEERGNWRALREAITEKSAFLSSYEISHEDRWGLTRNVDMDVSGPEGKTAPGRTKWIFRSQQGEEIPRLVTLYVKTTEWSRREREERS